MRRILLTCAACLLAVGTIGAAMPQDSQARSIKRGLWDSTWLYVSGAERTAILDDLDDGLRVQIVRVALAWPSVEPEPGRYDMAYLRFLRDAFAEADARGIEVMVSLYATPRWAADRRWWKKPPFPGYGGYQKFNPVKQDCLDDWQRTVRFLVGYMKPHVRYWSCWNEPNISWYLYPQRTAKDKQFAAHHYAKLLRRFWIAARQADRRVVVLAGETAPAGFNDKHRTSPLRFADGLKSVRAWRWFHAYAHHPYMPGVRRSPEQKPSFPRYTVSLGNISALLKKFRRKPFYLTEYGYPTSRARAWGNGYVSRTRQAAYLRRAYRYAARFNQVRGLVWFLRQDTSPDGTAAHPNAVCFGLRDLAGRKKPSWYAYAGLGR